MTKRDVATLACRILSLYVFYTAIISLPGFAAIPMLLQQRRANPADAAAPFTVLVAL